MKEKPSGRSFLRVWFMPALITATCVRVWLGPGEVVSQVHAQIPDSGLQRKQLLDEAERTNAFLGEIVDILKNRTIKVKAADTDNHADADAAAPSRSRGSSKN